MTFESSPHNKSLDASGGNASRNLLGAAKGALIRAAASTQPLGRSIGLIEIRKGNVMNMAAEKERLLRRDAEWAEMALEGHDVDRILSYWTDDAVVLPPGLPRVAGKAALREYVQGSMRIPGFKITWESKDATLSPDGQLAYMFSLNAVTLNAADGTPMTTNGRAVTIWRRESDGEWRCAVDIWNVESP